MLDEPTTMESEGFITKKLPCPCSEQREIAITFPTISPKKHFKYGIARCRRKCEECGQNILSERHLDGTCEYRVDPNVLLPPHHEF